MKGSTDSIAVVGRDWVPQPHVSIPEWNKRRLDGLTALASAVSAALLPTTAGAFVSE